MLKSDETKEYDDDALALKVPASEQGFDLDSQRVELGVLTHRSLLPVSITKRKLCAGVPRVILQK